MSRITAVVFGGVSNENEISVITGVMACNVMEWGGEEIIPVYISADGKFYAGKELARIETYRQKGYQRSLSAIIADGGIYLLNARKKIKKFIKTDCVLNCCHGGYGEGGGLWGVCAAAGIPFAGAGIFESAAFMDKYLTKKVVESLGVKTLPYVYVRQGESYPDGIAFPAIVKPASLGSSIGVKRVGCAEELKEALDCAFIYDSGAIIEKFAENRREINCAAYYADGKLCVSECEEAITDGEILSFEDKYQGGGRSVIPADIPESLSNKIRSVTRSVCQTLNVRGIVRFDFILSGDIYLSEINTVPGSLAYYLFAKNFREFYAVLRALVTQAQRDFELSRKTILATGILNNIPAGSPKGGKL